MFSYGYDPDLIEFVDLPVQAYLRRELKRPYIFTFRNRVTGHWAVAMVAGDNWGGKTMLDIGQLGDGKGEGPFCTRENAQSIINRMTRLITKAEARRQVRAGQRKRLGAINTEAREYAEGQRKMLGIVKARMGSVRADIFKETSNLAAEDAIDASAKDIFGPNAV